MLLLHVLYLEGVEILQQFVVLSENASQHFQRFILLHKEKTPKSTFDNYVNSKQNPSHLIPYMAKRGLSFSHDFGINRM